MKPARDESLVGQLGRLGGLVLVGVTLVVVLLVLRYSEAFDTQGSSERTSRRSAARDRLPVEDGTVFVGRLTWWEPPGSPFFWALHSSGQVALRLGSSGFELGPVSLFGLLRGLGVPTWRLRYEEVNCVVPSVWGGLRISLTTERDWLHFRAPDGDAALRLFRSHGVRVCSEIDC